MPGGSWSRFLVECPSSTARTWADASTFWDKDDNWPKKIKVLSEQPSVENVVDTQPFPQTRRCRKGEAPSPQGMGSMFIPSVGFHNSQILFVRYI